MYIVSQRKRDVLQAVSSGVVS